VAPQQDVAVPELAAARQAGAPWLLVDVRQPAEWHEGVLQGALLCGPHDLVERIASHGATSTTPIVVLCASGQRAAAAAQLLRDAGFDGARPLSGGLRAWRAAGLPLDLPPSQGDQPSGSLSDRDRLRFARHLSLQEVGEAGQLALRQARVLVVGCGGLGSPAALYLAAAGIGHLGLVDGDRVELSNLQRQIAHSEARVGQPKVASAAVAVRAIDASVQLELWQCDLDAVLADELVPRWDIILDCTDRLATRQQLSAACARHGKPYVYAAVHRFSGQVAVLDPRRGGPCYRCLFPQVPDAAALPACGEVGVLGVVPGVIGVLQATEALKLVLQVGEPLVGRLLLWDALDGSFRTLRTPRVADCRHCPPS
jgi:molybdopterin/thiamine biosynthesis adenylyltransferase/rhodanese-related sulfurtransferase